MQAVINGTMYNELKGLVGITSRSKYPREHRRMELKYDTWMIHSNLLSSSMLKPRVDFNSLLLAQEYFAQNCLASLRVK